MTTTSTGMHWQYNKDGTRHFDKYKSRGQRMEVAVALGGTPSVTYAATAPLPPDIDELVFAGFLESRPIEIVKAKTVDLYVPAESDFVLEGYVDPSEELLEGPFGDHTGFYSAADLYPVFHVTALTCRNDAIYPATVVGKPPMEDCYMAKATERIFLPMLRFLIPEIVDMELPIEGVFHNCALVSIDKKYPGQAKKVINALWGLGQMASTKFIAIFDKDIDLRDTSTVVWKLLNNVDPKRDLLISEGPLDALDHSASYFNFGGKMGIDATRKTREEGMGRDWPDEIQCPQKSKIKLQHDGKNMDFKKFSSLIMFEQTLFALPFAYLGVLFANGRHFSTWVLVTIAFVAARTAGMSFNRVIDAEIDGKNPRTKDRLVPSGKVTKSEVWLIGMLACLTLVGASFFLNNLCFYLSFPAIILLFTYSYFKRFSSSSHFYLGLVEAVAPIGGYIAVTGEISLVSVLLGCAILLWIAGLDIVYAVQDVDFDRKEEHLLVSVDVWAKSVAHSLGSLLCSVYLRNGYSRRNYQEKYAILVGFGLRRVNFYLSAKGCKTW